ncbi:MAG: hypothetical protein MRZ79_12880 [Bacteroidia bacterium]|nr:hypothetical protein [Bacteroidia bacterium]
MKLFVSLSFLLCLFTQSHAQQEYLKLPWSSMGDWKMEWQTKGEEKDTWALILNTNDTLYYSAYHNLINLSAEQVMKRVAKSIQPNYYYARFTVMKNVQAEDGGLEYALFAIESREYIPTTKPRTTIYMIAMGKEKSYIVSTHLPTHKLTGKDKKKWKSFFLKASLASGDIEQLMARLK